MIGWSAFHSGSNDVFKCCSLTTYQCWVHSEQFFIPDFYWPSLPLGNSWVVFSCQCKERHWNSVFMFSHFLPFSKLLNRDCKKDKSQHMTTKRRYSIHTYWLWDIDNGYTIHLCKNTYVISLVIFRKLVSRNILF